MSEPLNLLLAGFGGQGILFAGKLIATAGLIEGKELSWLPSYGPEMRGGTANCSVVLSDLPVGSPVVNRPTELIAMNGPSLKRFEPRCRPGALVLVNSSQALEKVVRDDLRAFYIPSMEEAARLGNIKVANMIMLGAYIRATGALRIETLEKMLAHIFTGPKAHLVELNIKALQAGAGYIA